MTHAESFFKDLWRISEEIDHDAIERLAHALRRLRKRGSGRLFVLGVGGSAANASHAVNDFRKLCGVEAYAPTDNVAELTARMNDEGGHTIFTGWLQVSRACEQDAILVLSVGGGGADVSASLVGAIDYARAQHMEIYGIVGPHGGYTAAHGHIVVRVPATSLMTPYTEAFQAIVWHCLVSHPELQINKTVW